MSQNKIYPLLALTVIFSVLISVGAFTILKSNFVGPSGEQGIQGETGLKGETGLSGKDGSQGQRGPIGAPGKDYVFNGEWVYVDGWEWEGTDSFTDIERSIEIEAELWRVYIVINSLERRDQYFGLIIYTVSENVTGAWATTSYYGADYLYCYGEGNHLINMFFDRQDSVKVIVEEYLSMSENGGIIS